MGEEGHARGQGGGDGGGLRRGGAASAAMRAAGGGTGSTAGPACVSPWGAKGICRRQARRGLRRQTGSSRRGGVGVGSCPRRRRGGRAPSVGGEANDRACASRQEGGGGQGHTCQWPATEVGARPDAMSYWRSHQRAGGRPGPRPPKGGGGDWGRGTEETGAA
jgi:hypothetical protein